MTTLTHCSIPPSSAYDKRSIKAMLYENFPIEFTYHGNFFRLLTLADLRKNELKTDDKGLKLALLRTRPQHGNK